jgi:hypothetical protein
VGVLAIASALVVVGGTAAKPGNGNGPKPQVTGPTGPHGKKGKARAYGKRCKGVSKRHIRGEKGTPHSQCVKALKRVAKRGVSPEDACEPLSNASDEAKCVAAAKKLAAGLRA